MEKRQNRYMEILNRKPFQGVLNVMKFNWTFYATSLLIIFCLQICTFLLNSQIVFYYQLVSFFVFLITFLSLLITYIVYDYSNLYTLNYLNFLNIKPTDSLVNINAGFDEFSFIISDKFKTKNLIVFDFYNPDEHTEISIERARKVSKIYPNTILIETSKLPLKENSIDFIFLFFAAHEIRNLQERIVFFQEIEKSLKHNGKVIVVEHLRNLQNFIAYTIGFFHFLPKKEWRKTFLSSDLIIKTETKMTPFVSVFILLKNGNTP